MNLSQILEADEDDELGSLAKQSIDRPQTDDELVQLEPRDELALRSGFVGLRERLQNLAERFQPSSASNANITAKRRSPTQIGSPKRVASPCGGDDRHDRAANKRGQFATLTEFFAGVGKKGCNTTLDNDHGLGDVRRADLDYAPRRSKIPVMKLRKEDWNVKCWEDRLRKHERGGDNARQFNSPVTPLPERRVEVFQDRIGDVATKLDKVREGQPQDETLFGLMLLKPAAPSSAAAVSAVVAGAPSRHEYTDMLKRELVSGTHDLKRLRGPQASSPKSFCSKTEGKKVVMSPIGRPIGRILQSDSDSDDSDA